MIAEVTLEDELNNIVYRKVQKGAYPAPIPTIEDEIQAKNKEINDLKSGKVPRPDTKIQYINLLEQLAAQKTNLLEENWYIISQNQSARDAVDSEYNTAINAAKANTANRWAAVRAYRTHLLTLCDWTHAGDTKLTGTKKTAWKDYRQALRDIPQTYSTPDTVVWPNPPI